MFVRSTLGTSLMRHAVIRIIVIADVIQCSMLAPKFFTRSGTIVMQALRLPITVPGLFRSESKSLLPLSTWIALSSRVDLDGVEVEAYVDSCRNLLDPIAF